MTTRRLAEQIEYSQPVLYSHFSGKDAIMAAVAVEGFAELAAELHTARTSAAGPRRRRRVLRRVRRKTTGALRDVHPPRRPALRQLHSTGRFARGFRRATPDLRPLAADGDRS